MPRGNLRQSRALTLRLILEAALGLASWGRFFLDLPPTVIRPRPNINPWRDINSGGYVSTRSYVAATGNATAPSVGNASDGILTTHPYGYKGKQLRDIKGYHGAPLGETIMQNATEGTIKQTTYWWPRPGTDKPLEKTAFYTKEGDQICGVGFYKE